MDRRAAAVAIVVVVATLTVSSPAFARVPGLHLHPTAQERIARAETRAGARGLSAARAGSRAGLSGPASVASVPDGSGGLYIAWEDLRDGTSDIYALRVTNAGAPAPGWPADGLPVCTAVGNQYSPVLLPDGSNGVIVGWSDFRGDALVGDGYAQRVTSSGTALWTANGVKGVSGVTVQGDAAIAADGSGGFVVAWSSMGLLDLDIFAVRFDGTGSLVTGWNASGTAVCDATGDQTTPTLARAAAGGAVIAWEDHRDVSGIHHIYAQLMNGSGVAQWFANGIVVDASSAGASGPAACPDGAGGALLFWSDLDNSDGVVGQRLNSSGAPQWGGGVVAGGSFASGIEATADGLGGGIATWAESGTGMTLMSQRINGAGALQWGTGTTIVTSPTGFSILGDVVPDGAGGAYFAWEGSATGFQNEDISAQRVNGSGAIQWAVGGVTVCSAGGEQFSPTAALDGTGGLLLAWVDQRSLDPEIYAQRLNAAGAAQFAANGLPALTNPGQQIASITVPVTTDVAAWTVWMQKRNGEYDIRAHAINGAGPIGSSIDVCAAAGHQILDAAIGDGAGGVIVTWTDRRSGRDDIYAQRLDNFGVPQWGVNGLAVCTTGEHVRGASMIPDDAGGAILVWDDQRTPGNPDIYAQRINSAGAALWGANGTAVCNDPGYQMVSVAAPDGAGGAIFSWLDLRSFLTPEIFAQRLNPTGAPQWTANGVSIATGSSFATPTGAVADGANGAIVLMNDYVIDQTSGSPIGNKLSAQRVDGTGAPQWGAAGTVVCDANAPAGFERIVSDGSSGAFIAWSDARGGVSDIYGQRINGAGAVQWGVNGTAICNATGWQTLGGVTRDGVGNLLLTWMDERAGFPDVYADRVSPSTGATQWNANGVAVSTAVRGQALPAIGEWNGFPPYHVYVSWTDNRAGNARFIYAQELDTNGAGLGTADGVVPVLLSFVRAEADPGQVRLSWYASTSVTATVYRRTSDGVWAAIGQAAADGRGMLEFVDQDVRAGGHYGYRLGVRDAGSEAFSNDVWVDVPSRLELTLEGLRPNPASRALVVSYALPTGAPARLELFDLSGRRLRVEELRGLTPGSHTLRLEGALPPPGLYFLRLTQAGRSVMARGAVTP